MRFLMVDKITALEPPKSARGVKCVSLSDDAFADHFAGWPIFPGALVLEAMAQLAGALIDETAAVAGESVLAMLVGVDRARFRRQVVPGDRIELEAEVEQRVEDGVRVRVAADVGGERVAEAVLSYALARDVAPAFVAERAKVRAVMRDGKWYR
jgi:3-hydroxyacyl-[acyl-carrier-protein] dehydratase